MNPTRHLQQVRDLRIERTVPFATPAQLLEELPLTDDQAEVVLRGREEVTAILDREDDRLLVVVGPCSVHDVEAAREYAERLAARSRRAARRPAASRCASTSRSRARRSAGRA